MPYPNIIATLSAVLVTAATALAQENRVPATHTTVSPPRAVILIIGDGMDDQQITIARNYLEGANGQLLLDSMPLRAAAQVLAIENEVDGSPVYVSDSANTATSIATGTVTSRARIATTAGSDEDLQTIVESASAAGYRTGLVTTASLTDATPAAFAAHISFRLCEGPDSMVDINYKGIPLGGCPADLLANGGKGSIAEQLAMSSLDVMLGGGRKHFDQNTETGPGSVTEMARQQGFDVVTTAEELQRTGSAKRLLGLFSSGTMPVRLQGENGRAAEKPDASMLNHLHPYLGEVTLPAPMHCEPNPEWAAVPSLQQMTDTALELLGRDNQRGFFLMVESASIDKQTHERKPCGAIGELEQLDEALASALAYAERHPHTLVIVTADHSQAAQLVPATSLYAAYPVPVYTPGMVARIITPEGNLMAVNYATNSFSHEEHTGAHVPVFSNSEGAGRIPAYIRQPELFTIMADYLGLTIGQPATD